MRGEPLCYRLDDPSHIHTFPGIAITLAGEPGSVMGDVTVDVPPEHLFINMGWDGCVACVCVCVRARALGSIGAGSHAHVLTPRG